MRKSITKFLRLRKGKNSQTSRSSRNSSAEHSAGDSVPLTPFALLESELESEELRRIVLEDVGGDSEHFSALAVAANDQSEATPHTTTNTVTTTGETEDLPAHRVAMTENNDALLGSTIVPKISDRGSRQHLTFQSPEAAAAAGYPDEANEAPHIVLSYNAIPVMEQTKLPRGGVSIETKAVGRVQVCSGMFRLFEFCLLVSTMEVRLTDTSFRSLAFLQKPSKIA